MREAGHLLQLNVSGLDQPDEFTAASLQGPVTAARELLAHAKEMQATEGDRPSFEGAPCLEQSLQDTHLELGLDSA